MGLFTRKRKPKRVIRAIPRTYRGVRFRSTLEARWAAFFDALGVDWRYEWDAYGDGRLGYVADFWLPDLALYHEVKGRPPSKRELDKARLCTEATGNPLVIFAGDVADIDGVLVRVDGRALNGWRYAHCVFCGALKLCPGGSGRCHCSRSTAGMTTALQAAYERAQRFQFEEAR